MNIVKSTLKFIQTKICLVSIFIFMNCGSDSDCIITYCKEGDKIALKLEIFNCLIDAT